MDRSSKLAITSQTGCIDAVTQSNYYVKISKWETKICNFKLDYPGKWQSHITYQILMKKITKGLTVDSETSVMKFCFS